MGPPGGVRTDEGLDTQESPSVNELIVFRRSFPVAWTHPARVASHRDDDQDAEGYSPSQMKVRQVGREGNILRHVFHTRHFG
jgi:hypothetical protein